MDVSQRYERMMALITGTRKWGFRNLLAVVALLAARPVHAHHEAHCREYAESIWHMDYEMRATRRKRDMQSIISAQNDAVVWPITLLQEMMDAGHTATSQADVDRVWQSMDAVETAKAAVFDAMGSGELLERHALLQFGDAQAAIHHTFCEIVCADHE